MENNKLLEGHRQAFLQSGNLSDFQINNMRSIVPYAFKTYGLQTFTLDYRFTDDSDAIVPGVVEYNLKFNGIPTYTKEQKEFSKKVVIESIKAVFFNETVVNLKVNGKLWN
jgi:hypothetical protein